MLIHRGIFTTLVVLWALLMATLVMGRTFDAVAQPAPEVYTITRGIVTATESETEDPGSPVAYFGIGYGTDAVAIVVPRENMSTLRLGELRGKVVKLQVVVER